VIVTILQRWGVRARAAVACLVLMVSAWPCFAYQLFEGNEFDCAIIGDAGNAADPTTNFGAVNYEYHIGQTEVTLGQYCDFLNAVAKTDQYVRLWSGSLANVGGLNAAVAGIARSGSSGSYRYEVIGPSGTNPSFADSPAARPVTHVSWFDAARYVNWLSTGDPEIGAYTLNNLWSGTCVARNPGVFFALPTENEWYKAAYYSPNKQSSTAGYWSYPTQSDAKPNLIKSDSTNQANLKNDGVFRVTERISVESNQNYLAEVDAFPASSSYYGTYGQAGNVAEWIAVPNAVRQLVRGGSWANEISYASKNVKVEFGGTTENDQIGFRIVYSSTESSGSRSGGGSRRTGRVIHVVSGTQFYAGSITGSGGVTKTGFGTCVFSQPSALTYSGMTTIHSGVLKLVAGSGTSISSYDSTFMPLAGGTLAISGFDMRVGGINALAGGLIDTGSSIITIDAGYADQDLVAALRLGRGDGSWNGESGITSSLVRLDVGRSLSREVGWIRDDVEKTIKLGYAVAGDTNMDGSFDFDDILSFVGAGLYGTGNTATWGTGDFDYDGKVDILDVLALMRSVEEGIFNGGSYRGISGALQEANRESAAISVAARAVPEPSGIVVAAFGFPALIYGFAVSRRRQKAAASPTPAIVQNEGSGTARTGTTTP